MQTLGYRSTPTLGKCLGFPIKHTLNPHDFGFVIERIQSRLAGWKSHLLSFARRLVLTQVVTGAIPSYTMQCSILPPKIIKCVDKLNRDFLWGSTKNNKKIHMVNWKKVMKPKKDGGLGLQTTKEKNTALLAKLNWRMHREKDSLWARVLT